MMRAGLLLSGTPGAAGKDKAVIISPLVLVEHHELPKYGSRFSEPDVLEQFKTWLRNGASDQITAQLPLETSINRKKNRCR
jgi:hypothetical protein